MKAGRRLHRAALGFAALVFCCGASAADSSRAGVVQLTGPAFVLDGDTMEIAGHRIRLYGVDAPELAQRCQRANGSTWTCGESAKAALAALVEGQQVSCTQRDLDRYRRVVAVCSVGRREINAALTTAGWTLAYREYSEDYVDEEAGARSARAGLWSGTFENPWDFRGSNEREAQVPTTSRSAACTIKGNISSNGTRIYHVKGGEFYEGTTISEQAGERWFCSEREARAAGWRKSRR